MHINKDLQKRILHEKPENWFYECYSPELC